MTTRADQSTETEEVKNRKTPWWGRFLLAFVGFALAMPISILVALLQILFGVWWAWTLSTILTIQLCSSLFVAYFPEFGLELFGQISKAFGDVLRPFVKLLFEIADGLG